MPHNSVILTDIIFYNLSYKSNLKDSQTIIINLRVTIWFGCAIPFAANAVLPLPVASQAVIRTDGNPSSHASISVVQGIKPPNLDGCLEAMLGSIPPSKFTVGTVTLISHSVTNIGDTAWAIP